METTNKTDEELRFKCVEIAATTCRNEENVLIVAQNMFEFIRNNVRAAGVIKHRPITESSKPIRV